MYKVTKKPLTPNTVWDSANGKPLCRFTKGVLETDDKALADRLASMGHTVEGTAAAENAKTAADTPKTTRKGRK